jgi:putative transposase
VAASSAAPGPLGRHKGPLFDAHRDDPEFDYWFMVDEALEAGEPMAERPAWKICWDLGWWSSHGKERGNGTKPGPPVHDDLCAITEKAA